MVATYETVADALAVRFRRPQMVVRIGGVVVPAYRANVRFGVKQPTGTASVTIGTPRPASLTIAADLEIEMGYPGALHRVFHGHIPDDETSIQERGKEIRIAGEGWASFLKDPDAFGTVFNDGIKLSDLMRSASLSRSVPTFKADYAYLLDGEEIVLGGNQFIDGGDVVIDDRTSPLQYLSRVASLFGYYVYDRPDGEFRMSLVSGIPDPQFDIGSPSVTFSNGDWGKSVATTNIRSGPGLSYSVVDSLSSSSYVLFVSDSTFTADGFTWQKIAAINETTGYVALTLAGVERFSTATPVVPIWRIAEGVNAYGFSQKRDQQPMRTYIDVRGARYTADDGGVVAIRSIAEEVEQSEYLRPLGYRIERFSDSALVTPELAEGCRQCREVDLGSLFLEESWTQAGNPLLQPGEIVMVNSETCEITNAARWLMDVEHTFDERQFTTACTAWSGGGEALAAGDDCRTEPINYSTVYHAGTQTISWYRDTTHDSVRDPAESDKDVADRRYIIDIPFTVSYEDYSSLRLLGICHGTNSINNKTAITGSKVEVWQLEDPSVAESGTNELKRVGSIELPTANEELSKRRNYASSDRYWQSFSLPMPGQLQVGAAHLYLVCGEERIKGRDNPEIDDYEITKMQLKYCGVGVPSLPGQIS